MKPGRGGILIFLLAGWIWLGPVLPVLAQPPELPKVLPVVLEFDRKLCPVCQASERVILTVKDMYPGQFVVTKLYMDEAEPMFRRYNVAIVPTQVFLDSSGKEVYRHEGIFKKEALIKKLQELKFIRD